MDDKIEQVQRAVGAVAEKIEERSLALEILQELKESGRRWQRAFFAMLILLALTIGAFIWYLAQYDYVSYQQDGEGYNNINTHVQGSVHNNNGTEGTSTQEENSIQESGG